jgi:hypothetical protein
VGKPKDPDYWKKWRAAHPEYRAREARRPRLHHSLGEKRKSRAVEVVPLLPVYASLQRGVAMSFWEDELRIDLAQERELAKLEGRDPDQAAKEYRAREQQWFQLALPLLALNEIE